MEASAWPEDPAERIKEIVERVLDQLELEGVVEITEDEDVITASV